MADRDALISALEPFALALKIARGRFDGPADQADVTAIACRYISYEDLKHALGAYAMAKAADDKGEPPSAPPK